MNSIIIDLLLVALAAIVFYFIGKSHAEAQEKINLEPLRQEQNALREQAVATKADIDSNKRILEQMRQNYREQSEALDRAYLARAQELDVKYAKIDEDMAREFQEKANRLDEEYSILFQEKQEEMEEVSHKLAALKATRDAAIAAARKEREVEDSPQDYSISLSPDESGDVRYLQEIMPRLHFPQVLGKYIWSAFYQKKAKALAANVLGDSVVCGIYKITDQLTHESYIGQSKNIANRWTEHIKCGIGASTASASNALYAAMRRDGIDSFTFEVLETCEPQDLDEKERFFINLYSTDTLGLNITKGNSKHSE